MRSARKRAQRRFGNAQRSLHGDVARDRKGRRFEAPFTRVFRRFCDLQFNDISEILFPYREH
jgi:hypothetical protein